MNRTNKVSALGLILLLLVSTLKAQEVDNELQTRTEVELSFKPIKKLKVTFMPQLRFDENFSLDKYLLETGAEYDLFKFLEVGATYRFIVNPRDTKDTEYLNRYGLSVTTKTELGRFEPSFRLSFTNYAEDDVDDKTFLRYKAGVKYDIPNCKLTPFVALEAFQELDEGDLYKMRYAAGIDYKLFKNNYLGLDYKLDYYQKEYTNMHIISLGYKIKF